MKAHIDWYIDQRVLYVKRPEIITLEELAEDSQRIIHLLDSSELPVHIINDTLNVEHMPKKLLGIKRSVPFLNHPHLGWFITLSDNALINFFGFVLPQTHLVNKKFQILRQLDESLTFLKKQDDTIDWTKANPDVFTPQLEILAEK